MITYIYLIYIDLLMEKQKSEIMFVCTISMNKAQYI